MNKQKGSDKGANAFLEPPQFSCNQRKVLQFLKSKGGGKGDRIRSQKIYSKINTSSSRDSRTWMQCYILKINKKQKT